MRGNTGGKAKRIEVRRRPGNARQGLLSVAGLVLPCALGSGGTTMLKREGDGATPIGSMQPLDGYFRRDRLRAGPPPAQVKLVATAARLGWCDAPDDRNYNRPVCLPYPASHERMCRDDRLYDVCVVLDWNIRPARRGRGSAIFLHIAKPGFSPTEGCIALAPRAMARLLPLLGRATRIRVHR